MKVLAMGDPHGDYANVRPKIFQAAEAGIQHIVVCGDFGLWTHEYEGHRFLDKINRAADLAELSIYVIAGNHENHDHWQWYLDNMPRSRGWAYVRDRILIAPKAHKWEWAGKQFVGAGGAVSIDAAHRLQKESGFYYDEWKGRHVQRSPEPRTLWWPDEQLTDDDVKTIDGWKLKADYLITHDCSNRTPFYDRLKPDMDSQIHRQRIDEVLKATLPDMHFHGHMHNKFDWVNMVPTDNDVHYTQTYGLEHNQSADSWGTLDVETGRFVWRATKFR